MKRVFSFCIAGFLCLTATGQEFKFRGVKYDDKVALFWLPDMWPRELKGVMIRQRIVGDESWESVTGTVIIPSTEQGKDLSAVTYDVLQDSVALAYKSFVDAGSLKYINEEEYRRTVLNDPDMLSVIGLLFRLDHYLAVYAGFGAIYRQPKKPVEYGLFRVYDEVEASPHKVISVETQDVPAISGKVEKKSGKGNFLTLWSYDPNELEALGYKGFNILYQNEGSWTRINNRVIHSLQRSEEAVITQPLSLSEDSTVTLGLEPVSYWHRTSPVFQLQVDPSRKQGKIDLQGQVEPDRIKLYWGGGSSFTDLQLNCMTMDGKVETIMVEGGEHEFVPERNGSYTFYLTALDQGIAVNSNYVTMTFRRASTSAAPQISSEYRSEQGDRFIRIYLDRQLSDELTTRLYVAFRPGETLAWDSSVKAASGNYLDYPIMKNFGADYRFAVAYKEDGVTSEKSNEIVVSVPSKVVPSVLSVAVGKEDGTPVVHWDYQNRIPDLAGFRIYVDDQLIQDESSKGTEDRFHTLETVENGLHQVWITAVTVTGVESEASRRVPFRVP